MARSCLWLAGLGSFGVEVLALAKLRHHAYEPVGLIAVFVGPLIAGFVLIWLARRLPPRRVQRFVLELVLLGLCIPVVEAGLTTFAWTSPSEQMRRIDTAARLGIPFDRRYKSQVVDAMRAQGVAAYPGIARDWLWQPYIKQRVGSAFYPLSQVANSQIVDSASGEAGERGWPAGEFCGCDFVSPGDDGFSDGVNYRAEHLRGLRELYLW